MKRTCKQCGEDFIVSNSEIAFYKQRKLALPKRCKNCREQNKQKKTQDGQSESIEQVSENKAEKMQLKQESQSQKQDGFQEEASKFQKQDGFRKEASKSRKKDRFRKEASQSQKKDEFRKETSKSQKKDEFQNDSSNQQSSTNSRKQYRDAVETTQKQTVEQKPKKTLKQKIAYGAVALLVLLAGGTGAAGLSSSNSSNVPENGYVQEAATQTDIVYTFRNEEMLQEHYEKHGVEMGFASAEEYLSAANAVCSNPEALQKKESEDGDDVYYVEATNEFVVISTDGYLRTYFHPEDGLDYFNRQ